MNSPLVDLTAALAGRYALDRELGAGGMATVYLAHDVKHNRKVAVKVLHPDLSAALGAERFLAEITTTANLQHPHILPLHDSGVAGSVLFYVMPFVDGESLRDRLARDRQLPIEDAVRIAREVADALAYAHARGVIHRDIKPENILLHGGHALVADFGIALAVQGAGGARMTQTGLSLGTPQYMSPEQAMGERVIDARSDVYALGAVLYEMLVGEPPFTGASVQAIVAKIMSEKPTAPSVVRDTVPTAIERAVMKALAKLPADRWPGAAAFGEALDARLGTGDLACGTGAAVDGAGSRATGVGAGWRRALGPVHLTVTVAALVAVAWLAFRTLAADVALPTRFALTFKPGEEFEGSFPQSIAISPDGRTIAYLGTGGFLTTGRMIYVRRLNELNARAIPGTMIARQPFFSPDGRWIGYFEPSLRKLFKVPVDGGAAIAITDADAVTTQGAAWANNDVIVLGSSLQSLGLGIVQASGGLVKPLANTALTTGSVQHRWPRVQPDGETVFFTSWSGANPSARIGVASLRTGNVIILDLHGTSALGLVSGHLFYLRADGVLMAVPFDAKSLTLTGESIPVLEGVSLSGLGAGNLALSDNGTLVYATGSNLRRLVLVDQKGGITPLSDERRAYGNPRYSPDGKRIALDISTPTTDIWTFEVQGKTLTRLTTQGTNDRPEWSQDGRRLLFRTTRNDTLQLWWQPSDGSGAGERLFATQFGPHEGVLTPDGKTLVYRVSPPGVARRDIFAVSMSGDRTPRPLATTEFDEMQPRLSPDGKWLAYTSDESGKYEVYVRALEGAAGHTLVSAGGGTEPVWARDGNRLFYRDGPKMMSATVVRSPAFAVTARAMLFEGNFDLASAHANYDASPSGKGFVMTASTEDRAQVVVVQNWMSELRMRLGAKAKGP